MFLPSLSGVTPLCRFKTAQRLIALGFAVTIPLTCHAAPADSPVQKDETPVTTAGSSSSQAAPSDDETLRQQVREMQARMEAMQRDYTRQLQEMQATITQLSATIRKTGAPPADSQSAASPAAPLGDQDVGEALIFDAAESTPTPSLKGASPSPLSAGSQTSSVQTGSLLNRVQQMTPDISILGDTIGHYANRRATPGRNRFSLRELEIAFQGAIDPYARADIFLTKPDGEEFEVEEAYATLLSLPFGFQSKIGKFRNAMGRINRIHGPELPQVDRPNVIANFFGDEGLAETGINISKILPLPWFSSLELEVANGDNEVMLGAGSLARPLLVAHMNNYLDLTTNTNLQIGFSGAFGSRGENATGSHEGRYRGIEGIDLTYRWVPPKNNRMLTWQTEFFAAQLESPSAGPDQLYGAYSFVESQLSRRWFAGLRLDYSQVPLQDVTEWAFAPYVSFWQSEFGRLRLEYKHTCRQNALSSDQAWVQYTFTLGEHRPHPF